MYVFMYLFIFERERERERERESKWGRGREEGERIPSRLRAISTESNVGLELTNQGIMT